MKRLLMLGVAHLPMIAMMAADEGSAGAAAEDTAAAAEVAPPAGRGKRLSDADVKEIRSLRALRHPDDHEKKGLPVWTHKMLADKFGTQAGVISQIVRNRSHKDPEYVPVNDGK